MMMMMKKEKNWRTALLWGRVAHVKPEPPITYEMANKMISFKVVKQWAELQELLCQLEVTW